MLSTQQTCARWNVFVVLQVVAMVVPSRLWNVYTDKMQGGFLSFAIETKETLP